MKREQDYGPYAFTLYLECIVSLLRILPSFLPATFLFGLGGVFLAFGLRVIGVLEAGQLDPWIDQNIMPLVIAGAVMIAFLPVVFSVLTLTVLPGGYGLTAKELDARPPNDEEREALLRAQTQILTEAPGGTIGPTRWLVLNKPDENAFVLGTTIYIHWGLINSEYLEAVLAHELGHLNHGDGRLMLALRRFVPPPLSFVSFERIGCLPLVLMAFGGGAGLLLLSPLWNRHWQRREFLADRFAYECGQAVGLIEFLKLYEFFDVAVPFGFLRRSHPHSAARTDKLNRYLREEGSVARQEAQSVSSTERVGTTDSYVVRKRGYTDAEAVLDMTVLDEAHAGWTTDETIAAERAWMNANGRRILTNGYVSYTMIGRGVVMMMWTGDPAERLSGQKFTYMRQSEHAKYLHSATSMAMQEIDPVVRMEWEQRVADYDPEYHLIALIVTLHEEAGRFGVSYYQLAPAGGGALEERIIELPPQE